jgi:hypothetical protein
MQEMWTKEHSGSAEAICPSAACLAIGKKERWPQLNSTRSQKPQTRESVCASFIDLNGEGLEYDHEEVTTYHTIFGIEE